MATLLLLAHVLASLIVMYACFCRLSKTTHETLATVRFTIWLMGSVASVALFAPFLWGWSPDGLHVAILLAIGLLQMATSRQWRSGVPERFMRRTLCNGR